MAPSKSKTNSGRGRGRGRPSKSHHKELITKLTKESGAGDGASTRNGPGRPKKSLKPVEAPKLKEVEKHQESENDDDENADLVENENGTGVGVATDTKTEAKRPRGRPTKHPKKIDDEVAVEDRMDDGDTNNDIDDDVGDDSGNEHDADVGEDTIIVGDEKGGETKRPRGRPKKHTTLSDNTSVTPLSYRGSNTTVKALVPTIVTQTGAVAKRRRGRPRKNPEAMVEDVDEDIESGNVNNQFSPINKKTSNTEVSSGQRPRKIQKIMFVADLESGTKVHDGPIHSSDEIPSSSKLPRPSRSSDGDTFEGAPVDDPDPNVEDMQIPNDQLYTFENDQAEMITHVLVSYPGAKEGEGVFRPIDTNMVQQRKKKKTANEIDMPFDEEGKGKVQETTQEANFLNADEITPETGKHPKPAHLAASIFETDGANEYKAEYIPTTDHSDTSLANTYKAPDAIMVAGDHVLDGPSMQLVSETSENNPGPLYSFPDPADGQDQAIGMAHAALEEADRGRSAVLGS